MNPFAGLRAAVAPELRLLKGRPKLWGALVAIAAVPTVYASTYLTSVWDPYGHLDRLPVAVVNADQGTRYQGQAYNVGKQVTDNLVARHSFEYQAMARPADARAAVARGDAYFALIVPEDFSARALAGDGKQPAHLQVLDSPGNSYMASLIARRFGTEVAHTLNETLGEQRWSVALGQVGQLKRGVGQLRDGAHRLSAGTQAVEAGAGQLSAGAWRAADGSRRIAAGTHQLSGGVHRLSDGMAQVGGAVRLMAAKAPTDADLNRLASGSAQVASGARRLGDGLSQLSSGQATLSARTGELAGGLDRIQAGSVELAAGSTRLTNGLRTVPLIGGMLAHGAGQLEDGTHRLQGGIALATTGSHQLAQGSSLVAARTKEAAEGAQRLADGATQVDGGVQRLSGGMKQLGGGLRTMARRLPPDRDLRRLSAGARTLDAKTHELSSGLATLSDGEARLTEGTHQLNDGTRRLAAGIDTLYERLPGGPGARDAHGMAVSVVSDEVAIAPVTNNGTAFAPYFISLSLWMGAVMTSFVFYYVRLAESQRASSQGARMLAKLLLPGVLVLAQAVVLGVSVRYGLGIVPLHPLAFYGTLILGSVSFLCCVGALMFMLGDAGRLLAVVLLVLQLAAGAGPYPIELSPGFFQVLHPFLPLSHMIRTLRAVMFGAYDGAWIGSLGKMALVGIVGLLAAYGLGRFMWRFVPDESYGPVVEL